MTHATLHNKHAPSVNSGSGSFRKKDLSRLLMTFRSCHLCGDRKGEVSYLQCSIKKMTHQMFLKYCETCSMSPACTPPQQCWCPCPCWDAPAGWTPWRCSLAPGRSRCNPNLCPPPHHSTSPQSEGQTVKRWRDEAKGRQEEETIREVFEGKDNDKERQR